MADAKTMQAMASHWVRLSSSPSTAMAASALTAGAALLNMPNTPCGKRRRAKISREYGSALDSMAMARPIKAIDGASKAVPEYVMPMGTVTMAATVMPQATAWPPCKVEARLPKMMYS